MWPHPALHCGPKQPHRVFMPAAVLAVFVPVIIRYLLADGIIRITIKSSTDSSAVKR